MKKIVFLLMLSVFLTSCGAKIWWIQDALAPFQKITQLETTLATESQALEKSFNEYVGEFEKTNSDDSGNVISQKQVKLKGIAFYKALDDYTIGFKKTLVASEISSTCQPALDVFDTDREEGVITFKEVKVKKAVEGMQDAAIGFVYIGETARISGLYGQIKSIIPLDCFSKK